MNDSLSVSSSYSSSNNSNSNSLNRSLFTNGSFLTATLSPTAHPHDMSSGGTRYALSGVEYYLPNGSFRRRAKSQVVFYGDDPQTHAEYNKQLIEDLILLKKQLKEKDDQIFKLNDIRNKLESEIQELSASLFEQAYSMVNEAKAETAHMEKLLKEANGKNDVLQAEVKALKELVITSTPSTPNKHLHPQLNGKPAGSSHSRQSSLTQQSFSVITGGAAHNGNGLCNSASSSHIGHNSNLPPTATSTPTQSASSASSNQQYSSQSSLSGDKSASLPPMSTSLLHPPTHGSTSIKEKGSSFFSKSHKRAPSHNDIQSNTKSLIDKLFQSSSNSSSRSNTTSIVHHNQQQPIITETAPPPEPLSFNINEFDTVYFKELVNWRNQPTLERDNEFMGRIFREDILPCLNFNDKKITDELLAAIESNHVCIEELSSSQLSNDSFPQVCGLSNIPSICQYKIKLSENGQWILISKLSRNRVISVCDFFTYLRYIKDGLVKCDIHEIYWNIIDLRKKMSLSKLGL